MDEIGDDLASARTTYLEDRHNVDTLVGKDDT
jgi:hypothetical protein